MYPVGTKCVITWQLIDEPKNMIGEIVTCIENNRIVVMREMYPPDVTPQEVRHGTDEGWHPAEWMLPLEDPDTSIMEDAEEIKRLADELVEHVDE